MWEVGLLLKNHMCSSKHLQDDVVKEVTFRCSGVEQGEVHRDSLPFPLSSMPTEADKAPAFAGNIHGVVPEVVGKNGGLWFVGESLARAPKLQQGGHSSSEQIKDHWPQESSRQQVSRAAESHKTIGVDLAKKPGQSGLQRPTGESHRIRQVGAARTSTASRAVWSCQRREASALKSDSRI